MKHSRKISLFIIITMIIMNFTTINVQALNEKSQSDDNIINMYESDNQASEIINYQSLKEVTAMLNQKSESELNLQDDVEMTKDIFDEDQSVNDEIQETYESDNVEETTNDSNEEINETDDNEENVNDSDEVINGSNEELEESDNNDEIINDSIGELGEENEIPTENKIDIIDNSEINAVDLNDEIIMEENEADLFSLTARAGEIYDINIISTTTVTVAKMEAWAKSKGATAEFISLAALYEKYASKRGKVNWALAYVQAAKETGYGKFGGVLTADYHNPCGLKNSTGGADDDPDAHKKFDNWDQGVIAHLDHLALYAGASGYPKTTYVPSYKSSDLKSNETYDPRHTGNWYATNVYGKAKTAIDLGGKWAPSTTYGAEVLGLYCQATGTKYAPAKSYLDVPAANATVVNNSLRVKGWAISAVGVRSVNVYLDDISIGTATYGNSREDIQSKYPNYFNSLNSGFDKTFDVGAFGSGKKTLKIVITANDGTTQTITTTINLKLAERAKLETPTANASISNNKLSIKGWALASSGVNYVNVYIDGEKVARANYGAVRTDVINAYPGYSTDGKVGYTADIDLSKVKNGTRKLEILVRAKDGTKQVISTNFIKELESIGNLETPTANAEITDGKLNIKGWALASSGVNYVNVYVDGTKVARASYGKTRTDVAKAYPQYDNAEKSGYTASVDISKLPAGTKKLEVLVRANDGTKKVYTLKFKNTLPAVGELETPTANAEITDGKLNIKGWALASSGVNYVNVYVDGTKVARASYGKTRTDIAKVYPQYDNAEKSGYTATVDVSKLSTGTKKLEILVRANDGSKQVIEKTIKVSSNLQARSILDTPTANAVITGDLLNISGWALHSSGIDYVNVYIDNTKVGRVTYGNDRPDVEKVYPGYSVGSKCGFKGTIDISSLSKGTKKLEILIRAKDGSKQVIARTITLSKAKTIYIDPGHDYGKDYGAVATHNGITYSETDLNIQVADYLKTELVNMGYDVVMYRKLGDTSIKSTSLYESLSARVNAANNIKADFYVSIHQNSATATAKGTEVWYNTENVNKLPTSEINNKIDKSSAAATTISQKVSAALNTTNRGAKIDDGFYVTRNTKMPSVLVECGFISNETEAKKLASSSYQKKIAKAIAEGIQSTIN